MQKLFRIQFYPESPNVAYVSEHTKGQAIKALEETWNTQLQIVSIDEASYDEVTDE